ncbi:immunity protein Imm5 [Amycolatopsis thermalba]|uniref:Immunity protein Imm5 n=1 Tax=Amycolatopsis thermalba TaxID=944492 RepID=A0ABY4NXV6_9PSEU|nr:MULTISPECIES: Imm5 family immunity protein [Amycolatopsis]UQS24842.1 immunity protein Imm5 [Amycolatopsis thermalba]
MPNLDTDTLARLADALPADGELPYADRRALHAGLGEALPRLELLCAERVQPIWDAAFPGDDRPRRLLGAARSGPADGSLKQAVRDVHTHLDNLSLRGGTAVSAGLAAWAVARNLVFGRPGEPGDVDGEIDLDPDDWSPCFYAASAAAGGPVWLDGSDPVARREFWRWYLLEAVPRAAGA